MTRLEKVEVVANNEQASEFANRMLKEGGMSYFEITELAYEIFIQKAEA